MNAKFWYLPGLVFLAGSAAAQNGSITGKVTAAGTGDPIEGVTISIAGTRSEVRSGPNGSYSILGVSPGTYRVFARRIGFATVEVRGVEVMIDRRRQLDFTLHAAGADSVEVIEFDAAVVDAAAVTSLINLNSRQALSLPTVTLPGALGVNGGYVQLPRSGANLSLADFRRGVTSLPSVRGGRPDATLYTIDGIEVNNPFYGFPALLAEPLATSGVTFSPANVDAEHGGAMSGMISQALREGGDRLAGAFEYQTAGLAGTLGSGASDASDASTIRGFLSGPMPIRRDAFRFSVAGTSIADRTGVLRTGNEWVGSGDIGHQQGIAKLTYAASPSLRFSLTGLSQQRTATDVDPGFVRNDSVAAATMSENSRLAIARAEKRFARTHIALTLAHTRGSRQTCSIWQGVCVEERLQRVPVGAEVPAFGSPPRAAPYAISGQYFGGESFRTNTARADLVLRATDNNLIKAGVYVAQHDLEYRDITGYRWVQGIVSTVRNVYRARPREVASYAQTVFEHDLLTLHLGVRYDYGITPGIGFTDPLIPTNKTTVREVCDGSAPGLNETPFQYGNQRGINACLAALEAGVSTLFDSAKKISQSDDYRPVAGRSAFSPRVGISLPVTEEAAIFINFGRYARSPVFHDAYRYTGTGTRAGMSAQSDQVCEAAYARPQSTECTPTFVLPEQIPEFVGNPSLPYQNATQWETGFSTRIGQLHSLDFSFFSNDQTRLPTVLSQAQVPDIGLTYGALRDQPIRTVVARGWLASNGVSVTVRQRRNKALAYSLNYTYERSAESGVRPDLAAEGIASNQVFPNIAEHSNPRNRPHLFNAEASLQWLDDTPRSLGRFGRVLLGNSRTVATLSSASGSESSLSGGACIPQVPCGLLARRVSGTSNLVNLMYSKSITTREPHWALVVRVQNLFNTDDGSGALVSLPFFTAGGGNSSPTGRNGVAFRRILAGMVVTF